MVRCPITREKVVSSKPTESANRSMPRASTRCGRTRGAIRNENIARRPLVGPRSRPKAASVPSTTASGATVKAMRKLLPAEERHSGCSATYSYQRTPKLSGGNCRKESLVKDCATRMISGTPRKTTARPFMMPTKLGLRTVLALVPHHELDHGERHPDRE